MFLSHLPYQVFCLHIQIKPFLSIFQWYDLITSKIDVKLNCFIFLANRWHDLKLADILIDLNNIHDSVRLAAMATCLVASLYFIPNQHHDIAKFGKYLCIIKN